MAARRVAAPGRRSLIALLLVGFVLVATGVIVRRVIGLQRQQELRDMQRTRDALVAERIRLDGAIRDASSRARLQPIAEQRLNMHIPTPEQQVFLPPAARPVSNTSTTRSASHDSL